MNNRGQLQIIAAMFVAVILVGTILVTFSQLRNSSVEKMPQILSATDEVQLAITQILCTTIRYYGSVLQVTGNSSYARNEARTFLYNQTANIPSMYPAWGISLNVTGISLRVNWFSSYSSSNGTLSMTYDLKGLGLSNISYEASSSLAVQADSGATMGQASITISEGAGNPVTSLGTQNFGFYNYTNSAWSVVNPSAFLATFTNGTYVISLPTGVDSSFYIVQVIDQRGLMAVASSSNYLTSSLNWNDSIYSYAHYVDVNGTDVDLNGEVGSHSNFTAQQYGPDSTFDTLTETPVVIPHPNAYYPSSFTLQGLTQAVSGSLANLQNDDGSYMGFSSWASATSAIPLYSNRTTTSVGGSSYYTLSQAGASQAGLTLSAGMSSVGRTLFGKLVYPLAGVNFINASTWTVNYRAWKDADPAIVYDAASSNVQSTLQNYISWPHTVGSSDNLLLVVTINTYNNAGIPANCSGCTYNGIAMTQRVTNVYATNPQVRSYIFTLTGLPTGSATIRADFSASTLSVGGAVSYRGVDQNTPIQSTGSSVGSGTVPSVAVNVVGNGRAVYGSLAGYRTATIATQVTFVSAGTGSGVTGNPTPAYPTGLQAKDLILLQVTVRDLTNTPTTPTGFTLLYDPNSTGTGRQWIYYKISDGTEAGTITVTIRGSNCKMARMYAFRNAAISSFDEGGGFGLGTGATISAQSVTTTDAKRLAVSFVFVNDGNAVDGFTGETGGDWIEAVPEFTTTAGSDGCVQLQTATMASAGTISGGSYTMSAADPWGVRAFALIPATAWTITDGADQNHRWGQIENTYKGDGDDKLDVSPGSASTSWTLSSAASYVALAIVISPTPPSAGHCDVDILIRQSDGTNRTVIAENEAASGPITTSASTLSGTYAWNDYTVIAQTDYLEFDFYTNTTTALAGATAYLMIDNSTLAPAQQTHIGNVCLPSQYTSAVVFEGVSDSQTWEQLNWTINSRCTTAGVTVTCQLYNFNTSAYPTSGDGYQTTTVGTTDVTQSQTISTNPTYYRNGTNWFRIVVQCVKTTTAQFYWNCDLVQFLTNYTTTSYRLDLEERWTYVDYSHTDQLAIHQVGSPIERLEVDVWSGSAWIPIFSDLASTWNNASISSYMTSSNFTVRFLDGNQTGDTVQNSWQIDAALVRTNSSRYEQLQNTTMALELLQNGTALWLGQPLANLTSRPIPPIAVKAFHVNQTINGVEREMPFQVEDWASNYRVPLGLSNNVSVFSGQNMLVCLVTPKVTAMKVWWNGSDDAVQTPLAYTNQYFTVNTVQRTATNGILNLKIDFSSGAFQVTSTAGSSVCTSELFRINNVVSRYGSAEPNYAITNGPVRAIIHHEVEWSNNGIPNCYDTLAHLVITLPANATYYTYALRLMFLNTTTTRTITDLCPIKLNSTINTIQTENGTASSFPIVTSTTGLFYNQSQTTWMHHWSQFISGTKGAGVMFTDNDNQRLYVFDSSTNRTGAINTDPIARKIELLPVNMSQVSLPNAFDVTWHGAVVTFDGTTPIYDQITKSGLWILAEYPPA